MQDKLLCFYDLNFLREIGGGGLDYNRISETLLISDCVVGKISGGQDQWWARSKGLIYLSPLLI